MAVRWTRQQWVEAETLEHLLLGVRAEEMESLVAELVVVSREAESMLSRLPSPS